MTDENKTEEKKEGKKLTEKEPIVTQHEQAIGGENT